MGVAVVAVGAVWTVHGFLARHDAAAKARRDAALDQPSQGRVFGGEASSVGAPASTTSAASAVTPHPASVPTVVASRPPVGATRATSGRSYYDAALLAGGVASAAGDSTGPLDDGAMASVAASAPNAGVSPLAAARGQVDSPLGQALTPTLTPRVSAGRLGNRSLILAQGAKIDCVGDTAFDSSEAGLSTCTVTKNVYSDDGRVVLIERGSQINSQYRSNLSPGQKRVFILSARIKTPNGVTVEIDSPAADALGRMGTGGSVNNHWGERVGAAFLLSMTQDAIGYLATRGGNNNSSTVFENTQQFGLCLRGHLADLVKQQRAAVGEFETAEPPLRRTGKSSALVAENLALHQGFGNRGTIDRNERTVGARREPVNRARQNFLARPGFTRDQHRCG